MQAVSGSIRRDPSRVALAAVAAGTLTAGLLWLGADARVTFAASPSPSATPMTLVSLEVWPVVRPPGVTEGRGAPGWRYTAQVDGIDVENLTPVTTLDVPAYWNIPLPVGTTARVAVRQIPRSGFRLDRVGCTETAGDTLIDREVSVTLVGDTASFEVGGVDPSYLCYFHNIPLDVPRTDTAREGQEVPTDATLSFAVILSALFAGALLLAVSRLRAR
jgi:hypothetical protein